MDVQTNNEERTTSGMVTAVQLRNDVDEILPGVIADRRWLHEHPEVGMQEFETAAFVAERLRQLGVEDLQTGVNVTGVTGLIRGQAGESDKVVLVRADMDALPILEENDVEYASKNPGVMHACGHDAHTAMLLGLTRVLLDRRSEFAGTVKVLFQPAEEIDPGGAIGMIEQGVLENPHVDIVLGLHVASGIPSGEIHLRSGPSNAAPDAWTIRIQGKGAHAAEPHEGVDPVVIGAQIVLALQTLVSRETDPMDSAVLSVTAFLAGDAFNVIPDTAELRGTVRTIRAEVREHLSRRLAEVAAGVGAAMGATVTTDYVFGAPSIVNDEAVVALVRDAAVQVVGEENVHESKVGMGGEDFS
ncbi:MAG TPA: amidohydrolase, partial [Thermomicrobiales bacterium]|nr:amidohydrolase [Thermomicrobiales bacterium]